MWPNSNSFCLHCVIGESLFSPAIPQLEPPSLAINYEATIIKVVVAARADWVGQPLIVAEKERSKNSDMASSSIEVRE